MKKDATAGHRVLGGARDVTKFKGKRPHLNMRGEATGVPNITRGRASDH